MRGREREREGKEERQRMRAYSEGNYMHPRWRDSANRTAETCTMMVVTFEASSFLRAEEKEYEFSSGVNHECTNSCCAMQTI